MLRNLALLVGVCGLLSSCSVANTAGTEKILGTWISEKDGCKEIYTFLPNHLRTYSSGNERGEAFYTLKEIAPGVYELVDRITKTNNGSDCDGHPGAPVGEKVKIYLHLSNGNKTMTLCADPNVQRCSDWVFEKQ